MGKCIVIAGQTASGKSDLAVHIALLLKKRGITAEIISADSRQIYKGLPISSAQITEKEMHGIRHHMLSVANPEKDFTVAEYKAKAEAVIDRLHQKNSIPIICGGTGLYIDNLVFKKIIPEVPPNQTLRKKLEHFQTQELFEMLKQRDSQRAQNIDPKNKRRLIRALEIIDMLGKVPTESPAALRYDTLFIGLRLPNEELEKKIKLRTKKRMRAGMAKEIKDLVYKQKISYRRLESLGMEFKWISLFLQKKITKAACIQGISKDTLAYAKRQMTWFKRNKNIHWFSMENKRETYEKVEEVLFNFLNK